MNMHSTRFSGLLRTTAMAGALCFATSFVSVADAAQGCGHGFHRGPYGGCKLNHPGRYATPAPYHPGCWRNHWGQLRCYR